MSLSSFGEMLADKKLKFITIDQKLDGDARSFSAIVDGYSEARAEEIASVLTADDDVTGFEIRPQQG